MKCDVCGETVYLPFKCHRCEGHFCEEHRLPENHHCTGLNKIKRVAKPTKRERATSRVIVNERPEEDNFSEIPVSSTDKQVVSDQGNFDKIDTRPNKPPRTHKSNEYWKNVTIALIIAAILLNLGLPFIWSAPPPDIKMGGAFGNPRPLYFYDLDASCNVYEQNIITALGLLSARTGVRFIRLPSPVALWIGGISYNCNEAMSTYGAIGESEAGYVISTAGLFIWNKIRLTSTDDGVILHETLHSMGFGHSENAGSIMYPYYPGYLQLETELTAFIQKAYVNNPLAYLNITPLNLCYVLIILAVGFFRNDE